MSHPIVFESDADSDRAIAMLTANGASISDAVREALVWHAAERSMQRVRDQVAMLNSDEQDLAEKAQILRDMETLRAW